MKSLKCIIWDWVELPALSCLEYKVCDKVLKFLDSGLDPAGYDIQTKIYRKVVK